MNPTPLLRTITTLTVFPLLMGVIPAHAAKVSPEIARTRYTEDKVFMRVALTGQKWTTKTRARTITSREAIADVSTTLDLKGNYKAVKDHLITLGYYISCAADISKGVDVSLATQFDFSQKLGAEISPKVNGKAGIDVTPKGNAKLAPKGKIGLTPPSFEGEIGELGAEIGTRPHTEIGAELGARVYGELGASQSFQPKISAHIDPGKIVMITIGKKVPTTPRARITLKGLHISIDACLGKATIRSFARYILQSTIEDTTIQILGPLHYI